MQFNIVDVRISRNIWVIKDAIAKIEDLKINISETASIYAFNNLDSYFQPYLAILRHDAWENDKLSILSELIKALEDKQ